MASLPEQFVLDEGTRRGDAALATLIGLGFDLAFNQQRLGISVALFAAGAAIILRARVRRRWEDDLLLAGAVVLASFSAIIAAEWVVVVDLVVAAALVIGVVAHTERPLLAVTIPDLLRRAGHVVACSLQAPAGLLVPVGRTLERVGSTRLRRAVRALSITTPILILFAALLASADQVFGSIIVPDPPAFDLGGWSVHAALTGIGALLGMTALLAARRPVPAAPDLPSIPRPLAPVEWGAILAGVNALFGLFVAIQFAFLFGGAERVRLTDGLTYAEYARSGFFQLLAVSILTVLLILALWDLGDMQRHKTRFNAGVTVLVALTGVILASAVMRMMLYERAFGFTLLRLVVMIALFTIGAVLACILATIWWDQRARVVALLCCCAIGALLVLNIVNPERFVAEHNVERFENTGKIDVAYLRLLGPDSAGASARVLPRLRGRERAALLEHLCGLADEPEGWGSTNLGRSRAKRALASLRCEENPSKASGLAGPRDQR